MQSYRSSLCDIHVQEKTVEYCGKTFKKSKKKVKWILSHQKLDHEIVCTISFNSGKKLVTHNGLTILETSNSVENISLDVKIGTSLVRLRVDRDNEALRFEQASHEDMDNAFVRFQNILAGPTSRIYQQYFNNS